MKADRVRSRFVPVDLATHFKNLSGYERDFPPINADAHERLHGPQKLIYTSASTTLDTNAGHAIYPPFPGRLIWVTLDVPGAPSGSSLVCDILLNGVTMFSGSDDSKPTIPAGQNWGYKAMNTRGHWNPDNNDYINVQITTISSATGPLHVVMAYRSNGR